uniref:Serine-threonine kinase receptor-associated protein n=1 Tax=Salmo trutta TaxID=8032 RepID=A0A674DHS9_SALTR
SREGDLIFSVAKDTVANGERLGTYNGHTGAWIVTNMLTGSADNSCRLWDCETGTCDGNIIMFSTDKQMGYQCFLNYFDLQDNQPYLTVPCAESKITSAVWGPLGEFVIAGHENGEINQFSAKSGEVLKKVKEHNRSTTSRPPCLTLQLLITSSPSKTERPVNSAAISPIMDHVVMGGQEATTTRIGKFEARFFHAAYE